MKFLHTADWQAGMKAAHVAARAREVRDERLAAGRRVVAAAVAHGAEFLVLAGDTFEDNAVDRVLIQQVADVLAAFPRDVYVLPGNHDPLCVGSVWEHPAWRDRPRVRVLRDRAPIAIPGGTLWPCPLNEKHGGDDPTLAIPPRDVSHGIRVGIAHGSVEGFDPADRYFPIARDAADRAQLDYLAVGHFHSAAAIGPRAMFSGSPEPTKFGERDSGRAIVVTIDAPHATPRVEAIRTGRLSWLQWRERCDDAGAIDRVIAQVERLTSPESTLLDVALEGLLAPGDDARLSRLDELVAARLMFGRVDASGLRPAPGDDAWIDALPAGAVRAAAARLRDDAASNDVAARALRELFAIATGGTSR